MKSWRTSLAGLCSAIGLFLVSDFDAAKDSPWVLRAGQIMAIAGSGLMGLSARDNGMTSEDAGAKPRIPTPG